MAELKTNFTKIRNRKIYPAFNVLHCLLSSLPYINVSLEYLKDPQALVI